MLNDIVSNYKAELCISFMKQTKVLVNKKVPNILCLCILPDTISQ